MQGMRELLRSSLGKSLSGLTPVDKLEAAWPVACGRSMAEHGVVTEYAEGVVTIAVSDDAWLQQMLHMRGQLTGELRRIAAVELREIHFQRTGGSKAVSRVGRPAKGKAAPRKGVGSHDGKS